MLLTSTCEIVGGVRCYKPWEKQVLNAAVTDNKNRRLDLEENEKMGR